MSGVRTKRTNRDLELYARITNIGRPSMTAARAQPLKRCNLNKEQNKELTENCVAIIIIYTLLFIIIITHIVVFVDKCVACNRFRLLTLSLALW